MQNVLTLDIEDWYQSSLDILGPGHANAPRPVAPSRRVVTNTRRLLRILAEFDTTATCFVLGSVAESYPGLVAEIRDAGHEIATHGYAHHLVYHLTPREFYADLRRSIETLEPLIDKPVHGHRAPYFSITHRSQWALRVLSDSGIQYDSSIFPIRRRLYGLPDWEGFPHTIRVGQGSLQEFPISTVSVMRQNIPVGGGGYFRLLPYCITRWAVRAINRCGEPVVFYLHPYELDTGELRHPLPDEDWAVRKVRLTQRLNRGKTEGKLRKLLSDFRWTSVSDWMAGHEIPVVVS